MSKAVLPIQECSHIIQKKTKKFLKIITNLCKSEKSILNVWRHLYNFLIGEIRNNGTKKNNFANSGPTAVPLYDDQIQ